ncbi:hypothetical protein SCP_0705940 [Sparassis crispa]|uniref:Uncharacterized protein n=1 Tax=Sparassis crispa TaxID=139825 RepID=A0A401GT68_9APHY|nr:hypothetical protein SCP_0705940 [Sparassis crispa]GBE85407.1 hypothetical protein SCP_0705940 [Sparassis crispa]
MVQDKPGTGEGKTATVTTTSLQPLHMPATPASISIIANMTTIAQPLAPSQIDSMPPHNA